MIRMLACRLFLALVVVLSLVASTGGCMSARERMTKDLQRGQDEFRRGNVLMAYRILSNPEMKKAGLGTGYSKLLKQVTKAAEFLIEKWMEKGDFWRNQGDLPKAYRYYSDIAGQLPPSDPLRSKLVFKAKILGERLSYMKKGISDLVARGQRQFEKGRYRQARDKLLEARWMAIENNLTFSIEYERIIEECNRRSPSEFDLPGSDEYDAEMSLLPVQREEIKEAPGKKSRKPRRKRKVKRRAKEPPVTVTEADNPEIGLLLRRGRVHMEKHQYVNAIVTFNKVLAISPEHPDAVKALEEMEPYRKQLIADRMKKANNYFAQEDLEKAAPLYQQVLNLDPNNIRAKEGLQMYRQLKKLKKEQQ